MRFEYHIHGHLIRIFNDMKKYGASICAVTGHGGMVGYESTRCSDVCGKLFPRLPHRSNNEEDPSRDRHCPCLKLNVKWIIKRLTRYFKECEEENHE